MYFLRILLFSVSAPLIISFIIVLICLVSGLLSFILISDPWCGLIFLIIFFGGLLVLFVYISSLAHNDFLSPSFDRLLILSPLIMLSILSPPLSLSWAFNFPISLSLFDSIFYIISIRLISYLLFVLLIVSQLTYFQQGALRDLSVYTYKKIPSYL